MAAKKKQPRLMNKGINFYLLALAFILAIGIMASTRHMPQKHIVRVINDTKEIVYDVPTERPANTPEDWKLLVNKSAGISIYHPDTWYPDNPEYKDYSGLRISKKDSIHTIEILLTETKSTSELSKEVNTVLENSISFERERNIQNIRIGDIDAKLVQKPSAGVMDVLVYGRNNKIVVCTLSVGGATRAVENDSPENLASESDFFEILETLQFSE